MPAPAKRMKTRIRKPVQARARDTREAILKAAAQVLGRKGYRDTTTNRIAERAGVSIGSLYEYFCNKDEIVAVLLDRHLTDGEALLGAQPADLSDPIGTLVEAYVAFHAADPALHRVLSHEAPLSPATRKRVASLDAKIAALVESALKGLVPHPALSARLMVDAVDALTHRWIVDAQGTPLPAGRLAAELKTMLGSYLERAMAGKGPRSHASP